MKAETFLTDDYRPAEDEPFMNDRQLEYFRRKLTDWRSDRVTRSSDGTRMPRGSGLNQPSRFRLSGMGKQPAT